MELLCAIVGIVVSGAVISAPPGPKAKQVIWTFEQDSGPPPTYPLNQEISFGTHQKVTSTSLYDPFYGKLQLIYDPTTDDDGDDNDFDHVIITDPTNSNNHCLSLSGEKVKFHNEEQYVGIVKVRFYDVCAEEEGPKWALDCGRVLFGVFNYEQDAYGIRFGPTFLMDDVAQRSTGWHTVEFRLIVGNDLGYGPVNGLHRYIEVYFDNALVGRHGFSSKLHSLTFTHWSDGSQENPFPNVYLDDVDFHETIASSGCRVAALRPRPTLSHSELGGSVDRVGGTSVDDFEVLSPYNGNFYVDSNTTVYDQFFDLYMCSSFNTALNNDTAHDYYLKLWITPVSYEAGEVRTTMDEDDDVFNVCVKTDTSVIQGYSAVTGATKLKFRIPRGDADDAPKPGLYWFTVCLYKDASDHDITRRQAREATVPGTVKMAFDERLVLIQGQTGTPIAGFEPYWIVNNNSPEEPEDYDDFPENNHSDILDWDTALSHGSTHSAGPSGGPAYVEADGETLDNFGFRIPVDEDNLNKLHKVVIEYPTSVERDMILSVTEATGSSSISDREPASCNVFLPGDYLTSTELSSSGLPVIPTTGANTFATRTFYIYPGGDLIVVAMTRTPEMNAAVRSIRVYVEGVTGQDAPDQPDYDAVLKATNIGIYYESHWGLRNTMGVFTNGQEHEDLALYNTWYDAPTVWDAPARYEALRNWMRYQDFVSTYIHTDTDRSNNYLNTLIMGMMVYRTGAFPSSALDKKNWEMWPNMPVQRPEGLEPKYHGTNIRTNTLGEDDYYASSGQTAIADFDFAALTAAVCQGERVKFIPVVDFRGTAELEYLSFHDFYEGGIDYGFNGFSNADVEAGITSQTDSDINSALSLMSRDGRVHAGSGGTGSGADHRSSENQLNGFNPLHPVVQARILDLAGDLGTSLKPFMSGSNYLGSSDFAPVASVAVTVNERTRTTLLVHSRVANVDSVALDGTQVYWKQSDWSYDDSTWKQFKESRPLSQPVDWDPTGDPNKNRFGRRYDYLVSSERLEEYMYWKNYELAGFDASLLGAFSGTTTTTKLMFLHQAPGFPNLKDDAFSTPGYISDFLRWGGVLPYDIDQSLAAIDYEYSSNYRGRMVHVAQNFSMYNTRYMDQGGDHLLPDDDDALWQRQRWFDYTGELFGGGPPVVARDYVMDQYVGWGGDDDQKGAMVFHQFIEPWFQSSTSEHHGWAYATTGREPIIGTNSEPADVRVYWDSGKTPVFTQHSSQGYTDAWTVPYGSFYNYWSTYLSGGINAGQIQLLVLSGWDTTILYGHEQQLSRALSGGS